MCLYRIRKARNFDVCVAINHVKIYIFHIYEIFFLPFYKNEIKNKITNDF